MAQSKKCKEMHAEQVAAAQEMFKSFKTFIIEEFVAKFGGSYERADNLPKDWRVFYAYKPECEEFLIERSKTFIHVAPNVDHKYQSPTFLRNLTSLISEYLSLYVAQKGWKRNDCTKYLQEMLFNKNKHVQLETTRYVKENKRAWGLQQKEKREQQEQKNKKRSRINVANAKPIELTEKQRMILETKSVNHRLKEKKKELGIKEKHVFYTREQEEKYLRQKAAYQARKLAERQKAMTIEITINGIVK